MIQHTGFQNHSAAHPSTIHYMRTSHILDLCANCTGIHPRGGKKKCSKNVKISYIRHSTQNLLYKTPYIKQSVNNLIQYII